MKREDLMEAMNDARDDYIEDMMQTMRSPAKPRRPKKPFVWTPGELEDEEYWLDADLPEEPLDEENPDRHYILPDDDDEEN